jgi:hypothetical protein
MRGQVLEVDRPLPRMDRLLLGHPRRSAFSLLPFTSNPCAGIKLILLHDLKQDDGIRIFFHETWEAYVKHLLNPFSLFNAPICSLAFEGKVKASARKNL